MSCRQWQAAETIKSHVSLAFLTMASCRNMDFSRVTLAPTGSAYDCIVLSPIKIFHCFRGYCYAAFHRWLRALDTGCWQRYTIQIKREQQYIISNTGVTTMKGAEKIVELTVGDIVTTLGLAKMQSASSPFVYTFPRTARPVRSKLRGCC